MKAIATWQGILERNLVVRVSGFSARFVELPPEVQDDIMRRRMHP
jgi:pyruvate-formate lyase